MCAQLACLESFEFCLLDYDRLLQQEPFGVVIACLTQSAAVSNQLCIIPADSRMWYMLFLSGSVELSFRLRNAVEHEEPLGSIMCCW